MDQRRWLPIVGRAFKILLTVQRRTPWAVARFWAGALGLLAARLSPRYWRVAEKNLEIAYGDAMTPRERARMIRRVFQHFTRAVVVEFLKAPSLTPDQLRRRVHVENFGVLDELLARGKGVIAVSAHLGNFELLSRRAALEGYDVAVIARQSHDAAFNALTDDIRQSGGYRVIARGDSTRDILKQLRRNGIIALLPDQKSEDVFVPFFGKLAGTVAGPAVLALKTGAPILPVFCWAKPNGLYEVITYPEIDTTPTGNFKADVHRIMSDITRVIEEQVRAHPEQWLWLHDRWRVIPPEGLDPATGRPLSSQPAGDAR